MNKIKNTIFNFLKKKDNDNTQLLNKVSKKVYEEYQYYLRNKDRLCSYEDYLLNYEDNRDKYVLNKWYDMTEVEYIKEQIKFIEPLLNTDTINVTDIDPDYYKSDERLIRNSAQRKLAFLKKKLEIAIKERDTLLNNQLSESTTSPINNIHLTSETNTNQTQEEPTPRDERFNNRFFIDYESFLFFVHQVEHFSSKPDSVTDYSYLFVKMKGKYIHNETSNKEFYNYTNQYFNTELTQLKSIDLRSERKRNNQFELGTIKYKQEQ